MTNAAPITPNVVYNPVFASWYPGIGVGSGVGVGSGSGSGGQSHLRHQETGSTEIIGHRGGQLGVPQLARSYTKQGSPGV